jgi:hypothetical protein
MAKQDQKADFIKTPKEVAFRYFYKEPAEKKSIKRNQQEGMSKVPMILKIKLPVEEAQNKVRVREKSHSEACDHSPISDFLIIKSSCPYL